MLIKFYFIFLVFCSSSCLFVLPARYLYLVYFHVVSVCIVLLSYWANIQTLKVIYGKYENFETDALNKDITWDVDGFIYLFSELQIAHFLYLLIRNLILQCCLSLVFDFLQVFTTNQSINKVNTYNYYLIAFHIHMNEKKIIKYFRFSALALPYLYYLHFYLVHGEMDF